MDPTHFDLRLRKLIVVAAWTLLAVFAYATVSKVELIYHLYYLLEPLLNHPSMRAYASIEHVFAYTMLGIVFCWAYPHSLLRICLMLFRTHPTSTALSDAEDLVKRVTLSLALRSSSDAGRGIGRS